MSQTTPIDQQTHSPCFPTYLAEPQVLTEAQWAHRLALTREQTDIIDATELMSDSHRLTGFVGRRAYMGQKFCIEYWSGFAHGTLADRIPGMTLEEELNLLAQQGYLTSPPPDLPSLPATTGHPFPGGHPPTSPQSPQLAYPPSPPDLVLPVPTPSSPTRSFTTDSIVPVANAVEELQAILIPTPSAQSGYSLSLRGAHPLTQIALWNRTRGRHPRRATGRLRFEDHRGTMREPPWLLRVGAKDPHPAPITLIFIIHNPLLNNAVTLVPNVAMPVKNMAIVPSTADTIPALYSWGLDDEHNDLDEDSRYNVDGELGDFRAV
ncbi:hypothetical protein SERLA73DRAFT_69956 [Serpula lacrymans var. lacrymans S7.3]|uniref:Uncharacterized protein n=2 Tax=Serpula lacrymans var. lacrymans TaxID=341189 RepID=F8PLG9_SERL3|nr:uncharacterized protein SERLADRAFT_434035 [Serpula lacrymans var. lacrymans S7.9]EGO02451.1 hypothetical protein SERLA73DRAFT_69956 [Serpula lacrymans var. lacrymans S7.3]EGO28181.1 hypothetical protein SERLADRAFT_434035 [Serpula lacrymans var. lacrymans S7.9]